jgi:hypothetical protein
MSSNTVCVDMLCFVIGVTIHACMAQHNTPYVYRQFTLMRLPSVPPPVYSCTYQQGDNERKQVFANAIVAAALTFSAATGGTAGAPLEDEPGFNCATQGNHICGPKGDAPAGLYRDGELIVPWTNYEHPEQDELYGVMPGTEYDNLAAQIANLASLDAQETYDYEAAQVDVKCATDTDCARYALENGMGFNGDPLGLPNGIVIDGYVTTDHGFEPVPFN